jgi:DNA-binding GntR family transcriptional regulator
MVAGMREPPGNLADRAYQAIKRRVIELNLAPGETFSETQLATELAFSKTPVREALARLRREGLVEVTARSGYRATPVTLQDARDLFAVRMLLEVEAAGLAAAVVVDHDQLARLDELCRASYRPDDPASITAFLRANTELHATIAEATGNRYLAAMVRRLLDQMERLFHVGLALTRRSEEIVHEHQDLLEALTAHDGERARSVTAAQIRASQQMVLGALLSSASVLSVPVSPR